MERRNDADILLKVDNQKINTHMRPLTKFEIKFYETIAEHYRERILVLPYCLWMKNWLRNIETILKTKQINCGE